MAGIPPSWEAVDLDEFDAVVVAEAAENAPMCYVRNVLLRAASRCFEIDDERWRIMTRKRWAGLTHDLHKLRHTTNTNLEFRGSVDENFLDACHPALDAELRPVRLRIMRTIESNLSIYDGGTKYPRDQDSLYECRDGYQDFLHSQGAEELRGIMRRYASKQNRLARQQCKPDVQKCTQHWKVIGGVGKGGIIVRSGSSLDSVKAESRLSTGALIEQKALDKDRLEYRLVSGTGPLTGWVSTKIQVQQKENPMVMKVDSSGLPEPVCSTDLDIPAPLVAKDASTSPANTAGSVGKTNLIIIGLMAAHMRTEARALRFSHVLRSVQSQEIPDQIEFIFVLSWSSTFELQSSLRRVISDAVTTMSPSADCRSTMFVIEQPQACSQFKHLAAALDTVELKLKQRADFQTDCESKPQTWVVFGDDDDIWHRRRISEYVRAIRFHPMVFGVGVFAVTTRANCNSEKKLTDSDMPVSEAEVDKFLRDGNGTRLEKDKSCVAWSAELRKLSATGSSFCVPGHLGLEYFDFCPRLRLVREFFTKTPPDIWSHRYCDLRFNEFLRSYPWYGQEMGLEVSFFVPQCWMLFYSTPIPDQRQWEQSVEVGSSAAAIDINNGHMSSNLHVEASDMELARRMREEFCEYEEDIMPSRLARYWSVFRNALELYLIPKLGKIDQRVFDLCVFMSVNSSFFKFSERLCNMKDKNKAEKAERMMYYVGQFYAKSLAPSMGTEVLWLKPDIFVGRDFYYNSQGFVVPLLGSQKQTV